MARNPFSLNLIDPDWRFNHTSA